MIREKPIWPTFIGIGPGRAATTTVYYALREHPQICMAQDTKETNFFNNQYARGAAWYQAFFAGCAPAKARGEISNTYFYDARVPARIAALLPEILLFTTLRNPFARIYSAYLYQKGSGEIESDLTFAGAVRRYPALIQQNYYTDIMQTYLAHFSRKQICIAFYDDLQADPANYICHLYDFLGVDTRYPSQEIQHYYNEMVEARFRVLTLFAHRLARFLRRRQLYSWLNRAKQASWLRQFFYRHLPQEAARMEPELWDMLAAHFIPQIKGVEKLTGRDLRPWYLP